jgi:hypothetical protein
LGTCVCVLRGAVVMVWWWRCGAPKKKSQLGVCGVCRCVSECVCVCVCVCVCRYVEGPDCDANLRKYGLWPPNAVCVPKVCLTCA